MYVLRNFGEETILRKVGLIHFKHSLRVADIIACILEGLPRELEEAGFIKLADTVRYMDPASMVRFALLHDVGKLSDSRFYNGDKVLDGEKKERLREHCFAGWYFVISRGGSFKLARYIFLHHENWDGTGYFGFIGRDIPLSCRLLAIADSYDVMRRGRPYCRPKSHAEASQELLAGCGSQFDPGLTPCVLRVIEKQLEQNSKEVS